MKSHHHRYRKPNLLLLLSVLVGLGVVVTTSAQGESLNANSRYEVEKATAITHVANLKWLSDVVKSGSVNSFDIDEGMDVRLFGKKGVKMGVTWGVPQGFNYHGPENSYAEFEQARNYEPDVYLSLRHRW